MTEAGLDDVTTAGTRIRTAAGAVRRVAVGLLFALLAPVVGAGAQVLRPIALPAALPGEPPSRTIKDTLFPTDTRETWPGGRRAAPYTPERTTPSSRLPTYMALFGAALLGGVALNECVEIGCTTFIPVVLAAGVGGGAGALLGVVIARLRAKPPESEPPLQPRAPSYIENRTALARRTQQPVPLAVIP